MARIQYPPPGRLIVSFIYSSVDALAESLSRLERTVGPVQFETVDIPTVTDKLYGEEMGHNLSRRFFSFERLVPRDGLPDLKKTCAKIEPHYADNIQGTLFRTVNIDPGIMTPDNLVMASYREYNHRIYLGGGVFGETELVWARGQFVRLPWTSPDYYHDESIDFFTRVRSTFELLEEITEIKVG